MSIFDDAYTDFEHMIFGDRVARVILWNLSDRIVTGISPRFPVIRLPANPHLNAEGVVESGLQRVESDDTQRLWCRFE